VKPQTHDCPTRWAERQPASRRTVVRLEAAREAPCHDNVPHCLPLARDGSEALRAAISDVLLTAEAGGSAQRGGCDV
jgi:hypothetical protein